MTYRKKLIEVALPLEAINQESAREKSIRHGHPSTLHLWWARRPLAACRAVLFASLVDDPSSHPEKFPTEEEQEKERQRLHDLIGRIENVETRGKSTQTVRGLVSWDDITNTSVVEEAQREIARCLAWEKGDEPPTKPEEVREYLSKHAPPIYDPFCGGGSIPLEAQRLGLEAHGSDINPVAVLITKALIEIPPKFANLPPVNPESRKNSLKTKTWYGAQGLAEDVRYYGQWMREQAFKRIGYLYPKVDLPSSPSPFSQDGRRGTGKGEENTPLSQNGRGDGGEGGATVIAWLWARTVKCPNPACGCQMPLVRSFELSTKKGKEAWVEPTINHSQQPPVVSFQVKSGKGKPLDETVNRKGAICICCSTPMPLDYVRAEGKAGRMGAQLMAIVAEGERGRAYLSPTNKDEEIVTSVKPEWKPEVNLPHNPRDFKTPNYGMRTFAELFTPRQLVALNTFCELVSEAREKILSDAVAFEIPDDSLPLCEGGKGATAYADAVATYLAIAVDRMSDYNSSICSWNSGRDNIRNTFARQAIPMTWDFAEVNPFSDSSGNFIGAVNWIAKVVEISPCSIQGFVQRLDATKSDIYAKSIVVSTDPPYYDNIGYADLSEFFYVWLRRSLSFIYPDLFSTIIIPDKERELVATPYRFGGSKQKAKEFFETGLGETFKRMREMAHDGYPLTVYYAFKQTETDDEVSLTEAKGNSDSRASTGWETMLEGLIKAGFSITGTWPMRTERSARSVSIGTNALASSIALVCRPRPETASSSTRRQFVNTLKRELPDALQKLQQGNIAPVDLAQASIGPGMEIYSRYSKILESDGERMPVRIALQLINQSLDEFLAEQEGEFDAETCFALIWFEQHTFTEGLFGDAETLSKAKNTAVQGMVDAGILTAKAGKVRLLCRDELPKNWNPQTDNRLTVWEATQHMIRELQDGAGNQGAANLLSQLGTIGEAARELAYRLYNICDRKGWAAEGVAYNSLVISWPEISRLAAETEEKIPLQVALF
jgi:putative DNA methylase